MKIAFEVQGSAPDPYTVTFERRGELNISAYCTCPAGDNGQYCKHRFSILAGSTKGVVSDNAKQVQIVAAWLPGSDVEARMRDVAEAERRFEAAKREVSKAKQELAQALRD